MPVARTEAPSADAARSAAGALTGSCAPAVTATRPPAAQRTARVASTPPTRVAGRWRATMAPASRARASTDPATANPQADSG
ncbi:hypothetical protein ACFPRL_06135 [Pseudoclavibacter helvolus]